MIGFKPHIVARITVRNEQGRRVGYLASVSGRQVFQDEHGKTLAVITRWKAPQPAPKVSACGGSFTPPGEYGEPR